MLGVGPALRLCRRSALDGPLSAMRLADSGGGPLWCSARRADVRRRMVCHTASLLGGMARRNAGKRAVDNFAEIPRVIKVFLDKKAQAGYCSDSCREAAAFRPVTADVGALSRNSLGQHADRAARLPRSFSAPAHGMPIAQSACHGRAVESRVSSCDALGAFRNSHLAANHDPEGILDL